MKTIVWDLDDVLNNLMESWLTTAWPQERSEFPVAYQQLRSNPPLAELRVPLADYLASLDRFRLSPAGQNLRPNPLVLAWFERQGCYFRHHVLTARPLCSVAPASAWVFTHFGRWIRHFHFVPSPRPDDRLPAYDQTKAEALGRIGQVDFFVDDSPENVAAAGPGVRGFVFPQPWNHAELTVSRILDELTQHSCK